MSKEKFETPHLDRLEALQKRAKAVGAHVCWHVGEAYVVNDVRLKTIDDAEQMVEKLHKWKDSNGAND